MRSCIQPIESVVLSLLVLTLAPLAQASPSSEAGSSKPYLIPDPQFATFPGDDILVQVQDQAASAVFAGPADPSFKVSLAQEIIQNRFQELGGKVDLVGADAPASVRPDKEQVTIHLLNYSQNLSAELEGLLDDADHEVLKDERRLGQNYVIRTRGRDIFLVGSSDQGLLYAATTLIQLIQPRGSNIAITRASIRDYPDFKFRIAADWLLSCEVNRWAYDYGDGREKLVARVKRKLDFCLLYKINGVRFEGFGWRLDRTEGYNEVLREVAIYARQRGIRLLHGGYGAGYALGSYQFFGGTKEGGDTDYQGRVFFNRRTYPDGAKYACIGHPYEDRQHFGKFPPDFTRTLGTCRSNEALNRLKAEELSAYVRAVEPGGLYIHHEDTDNYRDTAPEWAKRRCESCRKKWPNDQLKAVDGGAGGYAHGYNALLDAVFSVRNEETGYDARKHCFVNFISPTYTTYGTGESGSSVETVQEAHADWNNLLDLWMNISSLLKYKTTDVQIGFRETWPLEETRENWVPAFNSRLDERGLEMGIYMLAFHGADYTFNDYPFVTAPLMNVTFEGATTIENCSGSFAQEPMQLLNANYSWNVRAHGVFFPPTTHSESQRKYMRAAFNLEEPEEIVGPDGFLDQACVKMYGEVAGKSMYRFNRLYRIPRGFNYEALKDAIPHWHNERIYPLHTLAFQSQRHAGSWRADLVESHAGLAKIASTDVEAVLQDIMSQHWGDRSAVTQEGLNYVRAALAAEDLRPENKEDLVHLEKRLRLGDRYAATVSALHAAYRDIAAEDTAQARQSAEHARQQLDETQQIMDTQFEYQMIDADGGDQATWRYYTTLLGAKIDELERMLSVTQ